MNVVGTTSFGWFQQMCVSGYTRFDCVTTTTLRSLGATIASFDYACIGREESSSRARGREPPRDYLLVRETRGCCHRQRQRLHHDEREATLMQHRCCTCK
uniref:Uncharacterized protein n=1 Tax=Trichogramma kaykai TaxID=54128 RepID=A0ABD2X409_9HYME